MFVMEDRKIAPYLVLTFELLLNEKVEDFSFITS